MGYHPIILGVKPIFKGILRVQVDLRECLSGNPLRPHQSYWFLDQWFRGWGLVSFLPYENQGCKSKCKPIQAASLGLPDFANPPLEILSRLPDFVTDCTVLNVSNNCLCGGGCCLSILVLPQNSGNLQNEWLSFASFHTPQNPCAKTQTTLLSDHFAP